MWKLKMARPAFLANWRHFILILAIGQVLSMCITSTSVLSNKLAKYQNVSIPNFQSFLVYALLLIVYMPLAFIRLGRQAMWLNIKKRFYWYILFAAVDVEGNYFVIKAYNYTSLLSCMLLNTWTLPCVVILSFFLLKARYRWTQVLAVLICLGGMGLLIKGDMDAGKNYEAIDAAKGDIFMLIGATCYALSNTTEEFIVRHRPQYETVAWLGFFGTIINGVQMAIIEHQALRDLVWSKEVVGYTVGFGLVMFVLYTCAPFLFRLSSAAFYNLSILTSNFYGLIFSKYLFHENITPIYAGAYVLIVCGIFSFYILPERESGRMANVPGFRTRLPGDIAVDPNGSSNNNDDDNNNDNVCDEESAAVHNGVEAAAHYGKDDSVASVRKPEESNSIDKGSVYSSLDNSSLKQRIN